jgi:hypothetical protein
MFDFIRGQFSHQFNSFRRRWCRERSFPFTDVLSAGPEKVTATKFGPEKVTATKFG